MTEKRVFKKKSNLAGGSIMYRRWADWAEGDTVVMKYQEAKDDNYGKQTYIGEVVDCNFDEKMIGKTMGLNSSGSLISAMQKIEPGQMFMLTYNGKDKLTKGKYAGKEFHNMEIDLVEEDGALVDPTEDGSSFDNEDDDSGEEYF